MTAQVRLEGRNGRIARAFFVAGKTQREIAEEFDLTQPRVSQIIDEARKEMPVIDRAEMLRANLEVINYVQQVAQELVEKQGAPVTSGKDGEVVYDPESGDVVRNYDLRLAASNLLVRTADTLAKRLGLDAAQKIESMATVRYEIADVSTDDLT